MCTKYRVKLEVCSVLLEVYSIIFVQLPVHSVKCAVIFVQQYVERDVCIAKCAVRSEQ